MKQEEINRAYKMFNIPENEMPVYTNAYDFAAGFKKFTLLKESNVTYSNTSLPSAEIQRKREVY